MPKTKLGEETKNYGFKKQKSTPSCDIAKKLNNSELVDFSRKCFEKEKDSNEEYKEGITVINHPFPCCVIEDVLEGEEFFRGLRTELLGLEFLQKSNDLYKFRQSNSLASSTGSHIVQLKTLLLTRIRPWISKVVGVQLENTVDLFCAQYSHTDTLLCHDDELEGRRVAFILYLTEEWSEEDGGLLELFDTDCDGNPSNVVRKLLPQNNSLAFFEVSPVSFHQVSEVLSTTKTRLSVGGWFHGPALPRPSRPLPPSSPLINYVEMEEDEFYSWLNPAYLDPETQGDIQTRFEESSEISLPGFLTPDKYAAVCLALKKHSKWEKVGPPDRRNYVKLAGDTCQVLETCLKLFTSEAFFLMLSNLTGLKLHPLAPEDSDDDDETEEKNIAKVYNPRCRGGFCNWSPGSYSLIRDDDKEQAEFALDLRMFFNVSCWEESMGGHTSYIARGEDEELVTVEPEENTLSLVYRDRDSLRFVKYVNSEARKIESFHDVNFTYYE